MTLSTPFSGFSKSCSRKPLPTPLLSTPFSGFHEIIAFVMASRGESFNSLFGILALLMQYWWAVLILSTPFSGFWEGEEPITVDILLPFNSLFGIPFITRVIQCYLIDLSTPFSGFSAVLTPIPYSSPQLSTPFSGFGRKLKGSTTVSRSFNSLFGILEGELDLGGGDRGAFQLPFRDSARKLLIEKVKEHVTFNSLFGIRGS